MIYSEVRGRCGNQMFLYAVSRKLEKLYGEGITFNFYQIDKASETDPSWKDDLCFFNVKPYNTESYEDQMILKYGSSTQKMVFSIYRLICRLPYKKRPQFYKRQERMQPILNRFGIYDMVHGFYPLKKCKYQNQFVCGTYEDERFFSDIREELLKEFSTRTPPKNENIGLMKKITSSESVCVSFRRGDFLTDSNRGLRDICSMDYYSEAINKMAELSPEAKFFFFSDDIDWVKNNNNFGVESYYESGNDDIGEKMRLMSSCRHFIMSNSTFCWWAQYLSTNKNKIVISPDHWFNMNGYRHQLIDDGWVLIQC